VARRWARAMVLPGVEHVGADGQAAAGGVRQAVLGVVVERQRVGDGNALDLVGHIAGRGGAPVDLPRVDRLGATVLQAEVCDWPRFSGRKDTGAFCGLVPSEYSSRSSGSPRSKSGPSRSKSVLCPPLGGSI